MYPILPPPPPGFHETIHSLRGKFRESASNRLATANSAQAPLEPLDHRISNFMPQRGFAYQPRVKLWDCTVRSAVRRAGSLLK
jgi:hypothetical protein